MSFQKTTSSHHLKFLGLAMILVCVWFLYTVQDTTRYRITPGSSLRSSSSSLELMPLAEAKDYCLARRWEPYPYRQIRRKVYDLLLMYVFSLRYFVWMRSFPMERNSDKGIRNTELEWLEIRSKLPPSFLSHNHTFSLLRRYFQPSPQAPLTQVLCSGSDGRPRRFLRHPRSRKNIHQRAQTAVRPRKLVPL